MRMRMCTPCQLREPCMHAGQYTRWARCREMRMRMCTRARVPFACPDDRFKRWARCRDDGVRPMLIRVDISCACAPHASLESRACMPAGRRQ